MIKILGLLDVFATLLLIGVAASLNIPQGLIITISAYLIIKGVIFIIDIASIFDITAGVLLILSLFINLPPVLLLIAAVLVGVKGFTSLIS